MSVSVSHYAFFYICICEEKTANDDDWEGIQYYTRLKYVCLAENVERKITELVLLQKSISALNRSLSLPSDYF